MSRSFAAEGMDQFAPRANNGAMKTRFRDFRKARGLTLEQVASEAGMSAGNLSRLERGEIPYSQSTVETLARLYRCKVADLLDDDPEATAAEHLLAARFRAMDPADRKKLLKIAGVLSPGSDATDSEPSGVGQPGAPWGVSLTNS